MTIALLDVHYLQSGARAACVLADNWNSNAPAATFVQYIPSVEPYEPGNFYRRELPCLLAVLARLPASVDTLVIDGYVWLASLDRPGLGAHLFEAMGRTTPVVGIAKTAFAGYESCPEVVSVFRGISQKPLFVTAVGLSPLTAAQCVQNMAGPHRIPDLVRFADQLCRTEPLGSVPTGPTAGQDGSERYAHDP